MKMTKITEAKPKSNNKPICIYVSMNVHRHVYMFMDLYVYNTRYI